MPDRRIVTVLALATLAIAAPPVDAAFPGRNGRLAAVIESNRASSAHLFTMRADGSRRLRLNTTRSLSAVWSPDGRWIVLEARCPPRGCDGEVASQTRPWILLVDASTGQTIRIRTSQSSDVRPPHTPSWTANGGLLWMRSNPDEGGETAAITADRRGRHQRMVPIQGQVFSAIARAAPAGGLVAVSVLSPLSQIRVLPVGGGDQRVLADCVNVSDGSTPPCKAPGRLDWSPDGTRLAFDAVSSMSPGSVIRVVDVVTGTVQDVRPGTSPFWSPDGHLLGSLSPGHRIQIGPPAPGPVATLAIRRVRAADWQPRR
jgi:hypothetical protein